MISYVLPTHNRIERLQKTLAELSRLESHGAGGGAEVIVVDNASNPPVKSQAALANGLAVRTVRRERNEGAAARNIGVETARGEWIIMLDDDSFPLDCGHLHAIEEAPEDVVAIGAEIFLPDGRHESGGLPEVFIGCGVAIRRQAFLGAGGYDPAFDYYAEEYDLCAKLMLAGWRIVHDRRFRVRHEKIAAGRDMNRILHRLVRNNGWVAQRYSPEACRIGELHELISRYARIAVQERATGGFAQGAAELFETLAKQPRQTMPHSMFDRFTGLEHARQTLVRHPPLRGEARVAIVNEGKNSWVVRLALEEVGARIVTDEKDADMLVIGTLSPGPMLDSLVEHIWSEKPIIAAWEFEPAIEHPRARRQPTVNVS